MSALTGPRRPPASGAPAEALVVLLHGYGANGDDLIALADVFAPALPHAAFFAPDAPGELTMAGLAGGREWFPLADRSLAECARGVTTAGPVLHSLLDAELARAGLDEASLALVGFSQGTMMALHVGLRRKRPLAALVGFSGVLAVDDPAGLTATPTLLVHGTADEVLPARATLAAAQALGAADVPVEWHLRPGLPHGIDEVGLAMARDHLVRHLPRPSR